MLKNFFYLVFIAFFVPTVLGQYVSDVEWQEVLKFSNIVTSTLDDYIRNALPFVAKQEGSQILQNVQAELTKCESNAQTTRNIEQYKACSSLLLNNGMAALGGLQAKYRPYSSGASRKALFW